MSSDILDSGKRHSQYNKALSQLACLSQLQEEAHQIMPGGQDLKQKQEYTPPAELHVDTTSFFLNIGEENITNFNQEKEPEIFKISLKITLRNNLKCTYEGTTYYQCQFCKKNFSKPCQLGGHTQKTHRFQRVNIKQKPQ